MNQQIIKSMIEVPNANGTISITAYACRIDVTATRINAIIQTYMQYQYTYLGLIVMSKLKGKLDPDFYKAVIEKVKQKHIYF